ncbi:MAG: inverse autotransporter beta domain-containing protein, partial [Chlamydiia bacterium]|nr:inverse autotransporter beta domain-containing protein [Chlamydiia bacterium]
MKKTLAALTLGTLTLAADPSSSQAVLKHREHNGIGYNTGYTTAELFLAPKWKNNLLPFLDLRGHVFDNGKFATNAGLGLRYNWSDFTLGGNFYYDFREANNLNPHQLGAGLEFLWKYLDARINGYGPIANTQYENTPQFVKFSGHSAIFNRRLKAALPMIEGELGFPMPFGKRCGNWDLYGALGPYYLFKKTVNGSELGKAAGGQGRVELNLVDSYKMTALATYDKIFKWTVQGAFAVNFPFRKRKDTANSLCLARNQLPYRQEIIPVQSKNVREIPPFNIVFVRNTSSSNGTFESPYPTLALAQANSAPGDVIYVFNGDGTSTGMNAGITLQAKQRFHGEGASMDLGGFVVPALSSNRPLISNTGGPTVNLSTSNTVAGLNIVSTSTDNGIDNTGVSGGSYIIADNVISSTGVGINLVNAIDGQSILINNTLYNLTGIGINVESTANTYQAVVNDNSVRNTSGGASLEFHTTNAAQLGAAMAGNTLIDNTDKPTLFLTVAGTSAMSVYGHNNLSQPNSSGFTESALNIAQSANTHLSVQFIANTFSQSSPVFYIVTASDMRGLFENNHMVNTLGSGCIELFPSGAAEMQLTFRKNVMFSRASFATLDLNPGAGAVTYDNTLIADSNLIMSQTVAAFNFDQLSPTGGMSRINLYNNKCLSVNPNSLNNSNTALMLAEVLNNVMQTQNTEALKFTVTASAMTCAKVAGNVTN